MFPTFTSVEAKFNLSVWPTAPSCSIFSFNNHTIHVFLCDKNPIKFAVFGPQVAQLPLEVRDGRWHHICISWTTRDGQWDAYQDGGKLGTGDNLAAWHPIKPGGVIILGQEQVSQCRRTPEVLDKI